MLVVLSGGIVAELLWFSPPHHVITNETEISTVGA